jgi:acyl-CoA thioester hydrolase
MIPYLVAVRPEWVDYNRHLNEGYFAVIFADASDHLLDQLGFGPGYREVKGGTFYTVETHIRFLREVPEHSRLRVDSQVVGVDPKRLHLWHELVDGSGFVAATAETMLVHVDIEQATVTVMGEELEVAARALLVPALPAGAGRSIRAVPSS